MEFQNMRSMEYLEDGHAEEAYAANLDKSEIPNEIVDEAQEAIQNENQEHQLEVTVSDVEMSEEKLAESSLNKLKYQEVEAIFRAESKQIIFTQAVERTKFHILGEQKSDILRLINEQQREAEELEIESESSDRRAQYSTEEIQSLHQRVLGNEVIGSTLNDFVKNMKNNIDSWKQRNQKYLEKAREQRKKFENLERSTGSRINRLKKGIEDRRKFSGNGKYQQIQNQNLLLKSQVTERKEYLANLIQQRKEICTNLEYIVSLKEKMKNTEDLLKEKTCTLEKLKIDLKIKGDSKKAIENLKKQLEEKEVSVDNFQREIACKENEILTFIKENEDLRKRLDETVQNSSDLEQKLTDLLGNVNEKSAIIDLATEKFENLLKTQNTTLESLKNEVFSLKDENNDLKNTIEMKTKKYTEKLEEKNEILITKIALDKKVSLDKQFLSNIKELDDKIKMRKKKTDALEEDLQKLSEDNTLQDIIKNKAYLISSKEYLSEKLENKTTQLNEMRNLLKEKQDQQKKLENEVEKRQEAIESLKKQLIDNENSTPRTELPTGILKSVPNSKQNPISPKKVKFENVSSYESSLSGETKQEKTFDQLLKEFQKNKAIQTTKKRVLHLD